MVLGATPERATISRKIPSTTNFWGKLKPNGQKDLNADDIESEGSLGIRKSHSKNINRQNSQTSRAALDHNFSMNASTTSQTRFNRREFSRSNTNPSAFSSRSPSFSRTISISAANKHQKIGNADSQTGFFGRRETDKQTEIRNCVSLTSLPSTNKLWRETADHDSQHVSVEEMERRRIFFHQEMRKKRSCLAIIMTLMVVGLALFVSESVGYSRLEDWFTGSDNEILLWYRKKFAKNISSIDSYPFHQCQWTPPSKKKNEHLSEVESSFPDGINMCCNGLQTNCKLPVNEIMFATVHNAMSSKADNFYTPSNAHRLEDALEDGYRGILLESCTCSNEIHFCYSQCEYGSRGAKGVFEALKKFLIGNPYEVLVVKTKIMNEFQMFELLGIIHETEILDLLYVHPSSKSNWPLMREMIHAKKRLVLFYDSPVHLCAGDTCPEGFHNGNTYLDETNDQIKSLNWLQDYTTSCSTNSGTDRPRSFLVSNHYTVQTLNGTVFSNHLEAEAVNSQAVLSDRNFACKRRTGTNVNLLVVASWDIGDAVHIVQENNKAVAIASLK